MDDLPGFGIMLPDGRAAIVARFHPRITKAHVDELRETIGDGLGEAEMRDIIETFAREHGYSVAIHVDTPNDTVG
jgi:hypothetical protein